MEIIFIAIVIAYMIYTFKNYNTEEFNKINQAKPMRFEGDLAEHEAGLLVALLAKVAKADGRVCELEAEVLKHTFHDIAINFINSDEVKEKLKAIYTKEKESFDNTITVSQKLLKLTKHEYRKRLKILEYLLNMAFIDRDFSKTEFMIIEDIANALEIQKSDLENLVAQFEQFYANQANFEVANLEKAYEILGSTKEEEFNTIKQKYRKLVKQHHPDIIKGQGGDENIIKEATAKLQEINEAYELIKKDKGQ
jgi:DnaJ like chaperone protein